MAVISRVSQPSDSSASCKRQPVDHRGQHAHVVGGGLLDAGVAGGELGAAEDVAAADDDGDLHAVLGGPVGLPGDVDDFVHAMPRSPGAAKLSPESFSRIRLYGLLGVDMGADSLGMWDRRVHAVS